MAAETFDDPRAPTPAPTESVSSAGVAPKPYRSSGGGKGRHTSRSAAKLATEEVRFPVLPDPVASEPPIEEPPGEPAGAAWASPAPDAGEPAMLAAVLPAPMLTEPMLREPPLREPVPEYLPPEMPIGEDLRQESEAPHGLAADAPAPPGPAPAAPSSPEQASPEPSSPEPASPEPSSPGPSSATPDGPTAGPASDPIPAVTAAVQPEPAVVSPPATVPPGAKPKPTYHNKSLEIAMTTTKDLLSLGQANVEAVIKSGQIWASGVQDITRTMAESAQAQFDHTVGTWKALSGTKSLKEAFDIQSSRTRAAMEKAVADGSKLTDASLKLAEQAFAPITARITVATESFSKPA